MSKGKAREVRCFTDLRIDIVELGVSQASGVIVKVLSFFYSLISGVKAGRYASRGMTPLYATKPGTAYGI